MRYEIRELGVGGILDRAITLTKNHFGLLFGIVLVLQVPFSLIASFVQLSLMPELPQSPTPADVAAIQQAAVANLWMTIPIVLVGVLIIAPITNAALIHAIANEYLEKPASVFSSFGRAFARLVPLIWTWILLYLAVVGGTILCIVPGILAAFWFSLATQVVVVEGTSGFDALKRSRALMKGNIGTLVVLVLLLAAIGVGVGFGLRFIPEPHVRVIVSVLLQTIMGLFGAAAVVVFYFSCRCGLEHFDLTLLAQGIGAELPEETAGDVWEDDARDV